MFERYRDDARRAIFFSRWEAHQSSSTYIEPKHILLGLTHDADSKANQLFGLSACTENFRSLLGVHASAESSTWGDIPLSNPSKRILAYAAEEADRLASKPIGTEHFLLGLLREKKSDVPQTLTTAGIDLQSARNLIRAAQGPPVPGPEPDDRKASLRPLRPALDREPHRKETSLRPLRPFAAFALLIAVLSLFYLLVRLVNS